MRRLVGIRWDRRRGVARVLLVLCVLCGVALPASGVMMVIVETPWFITGMAEGAFGVVARGTMEWGFEFEWDAEGWEPRYAFLPGWRRIDSRSWHSG